MGPDYSPRPMGPLHIALLGSFRVSVGDATLVAGGVKQRAVLAMLALRAGETVPEARIIDGVWGEATPNMVRNSLQVYVAHWRRVLSEAGCSETIERVGAGYRLVADSSVVDTVRFDALWARARTALGEERFGVAAQRYDEALSLWRGDALQDFVGMPFHQSSVVALDASRVQALAERMDALIGLGRGGELVGELESLVMQHPYEERFRALLMHALYRAGRQVDALRVCEQARAALADVGLVPGPQLQAMEQRVLQQDAALEYRPSPFTPVGAPEPISSVVGREDDVALLVGLIVAGDDRLVALTGTGGVGKSRLALEVANRVQDEGWMPVAYVHVSESADRALLESSINAAFGVPVSWRERPVADVTRMLGQTPMLVVLDGVEHVLAAAREVVADVLANGRQLRVMITSRVPLGLAGERQFAVRPLRCRTGAVDATTEPAASAAALAPAVQLFIDRAGRFSAGGEFDARSLSVITDICDEVDGLPLAIELAAARVGTLGVEGLRSRLAHRLDVVASAHRAGDARHRSLREVIRWSYELLGNGGRDLLAGLSVFSGGFTVGHAEGVLGEYVSTGVLDAFEELERHSLLARVAGWSGDLPRFRLLRTVRDFAKEELDRSGTARAVHRKLVEWVTRSVEETGGRIGVGAHQFDGLEADADNARGAVVWALEAGEVDTAAALCNLLYPWWMTCGRAEELARWCIELVDSDPANYSASLKLIAGRVYGRKDRVVLSNRLLSEAAAEFSASGNEEGSVHAKTSMVENLVHIGEFTRAEELVAELESSRGSAFDVEVVCRVLHARCWLHGSTDRLVDAERTAHELVRLSKTAGLIEFAAKTLADLAWIARLQRDSERALEVAAEAVALAVTAGTGGAVVSAYTEYAFALLGVGRLADSIAAVGFALRYESGDDLSPTSVLRLALVLARAAGDAGLLPTLERAKDLARNTVRAHPTVTMWKADVEAISGLYSEVVEAARELGGHLDESALYPMARSLGAQLLEERMTR